MLQVPVNRIPVRYEREAIVERNIIGGKYQILHTLFEDNSYCVAICRNITVQENTNTYILNIYRSVSTKQKVAPICTKINSNICRYFIEFFVDNSDLVSVFTYNELDPIVKFLEKNELTFKARLALGSDFLLELVRNDNVPTLMKLCLLKPENIATDGNGHVLFNFVIDFKNSFEAYTPEAELTVPYFNSVLVILSLILGNEKKLPDKLKEFLSKIKSGEFKQTGTLYSEFKTLADLLLQEADADSKSLEHRAHSIGAMVLKKYLKIPSAVVMLRIFIAVLVLALLSAGGYFVYQFILEDRLYSNSIQTAAESDIKNSVKIIDPSQEAVSSEPAQTTTVQETTKAAAVDEKVYTVKKGDTLSKIAQAFYGDGEKYTLIVEANKLTTLTIHEGMMLKIPKE